MADGSHILAEQQPRQEHFISWCPPKPGWVKVNVDSCAKGNPGLAGAGGLIRDENNAWKSRFVCNLGITHNRLGEMWGVYYELEMAWTKGYKNVELNCDSATTVLMIKQGASNLHPMFNLVEACREIYRQDWVIMLEHAYCADWLANKSLDYPLGLTIFESPPYELSNWIFDDLSGVARFRFLF